MPEHLEAPIEKEMQSSYIDYAMSVIVGRALPDARDGLKPVQRRILYGMYLAGNTHNHPTRKSAKITGDIMGRFHPHGDAAIYDAIVRMTQNFSMNHPLVHGQGNMGSIDGDSAAAQRYTEVRLEEFAESMLEDIDKEAVLFVPNYDNTEQEPLVLPSKIPNLLVNGSAGIAVGVATNILPHNLGEVCDAVLAYLDNREITAAELMNYVKGPDFPTGGSVFYNTALTSSYTAGRGTVVIRGKTVIEKLKNRSAIIVTEIPYNVNKAAMVGEIANNVRNKRIIGISDLRDESGKEGIRVVIELKQDAEPDFVLNQLYKHTQLQTSMPVMNIAVIDKHLVTFNLRSYIKTFVDHRVDVIKKRTAFDLKVASDRLHIVNGLLIAVQDIDSVIATIKKSTDLKEARATLISGYGVTEIQANAILDMKLSKLTSLETSLLESEKSELMTNIANLDAILADEAKVYQIIRDETKLMKQTYARPRRTVIDYNAPIQEFSREDLLVDEETTIILTKNNYMKRLPTRVYRAQDRGGKGIIAIELKENDFVKQITTCLLKDYLLMLSNKGRAYWLKAYMVPEESRYSIGKAAVNLVKLSEGEKIETIINTRIFAKSFLTFITAKGRIKRTEAEHFSHPRSNGINAIPILQGDELADVCLSDGKSELLIATKLGKSLRFKETDIRPMGRTAQGIRGIRLNASDSVVNMISAVAKDLVASITENGFGKVTELEKYRLQKRGGKGVINVRIKDKIGDVVKVLKVQNDDNILMVSSKGLSITFPVASVRVTGRGASGVRLMRLDGGAKVVDGQTISRPHQPSNEQVQSS
ncbi:MAG: DNA gyrase subunit A [Candidatus Micrarchaeota archaeon]|nr:DNA gyrase subunit A [Candidatus Micrarchaeota archaeon]